jgi:uncharacterized protein
LNATVPPLRAATGHPSVPYVTPFLAFVGIMAIERSAGLSPQWSYPIRYLAVLALIVWLARRLIAWRPSRPLLSILLGVAVFCVWVAPDVLFHYRGHWLFENALTGKAASSAPLELKSNLAFIVVRFLGATLLVPVVEELFWRAWLMRWLIDNDFRRVALGTFAPASFWIVAALFASEHGSYWEVGLIAGVLYNWWMVRTRNLADCILAHAVTNGILSAYVLLADQWQYWL